MLKAEFKVWWVCGAPLGGCLIIPHPINLWSKFLHPVTSSMANLYNYIPFYLIWISPFICPQISCNLHFFFTLIYPISWNPKEDLIICSNCSSHLVILILSSIFSYLSNIVLCWTVIFIFGKIKWLWLLLIFACVIGGLVFCVMGLNEV